MSEFFDKKNPGLYRATKIYERHTVLHNFDFIPEPGASYVLTGESGAGKTTILRLLAGLETVQDGICIPYERFGIVFQENRLCETFSAIENVCLIDSAITREDARRELSAILPENQLTCPISELSGGMKRRVAIVRACMARGSALMFDEPFTGLDEKNRELTLSYIMHKKEDRTLIFSAHSADGYPFCKEIEVASPVNAM